jgi:hypothetical protein
MRIGVGILLRHPPVHQRSGAASSAQVLNTGGVCVLYLPASHLDERLVLSRILSLKAIDPGQPPIPTYTLRITAHVTLITLAIRHSRLSLPLKISHPHVRIEVFFALNLHAIPPTINRPVISKVLQSRENLTAPYSIRSKNRYNLLTVYSHYSPSFVIAFATL